MQNNQLSKPNNTKNPSTDSQEALVQAYAKTLRLQKIRALLFTLPLILFIIVFFISPIGYVLLKSFYNPKIIKIAPNTSEVIKNWENIQSIPNEEVFKSVAYDIKAMEAERNSGKFAEEVNRRAPKTGSVIKRTARSLKGTELNTVKNFTTLFTSIHPSWGETHIWHGIRNASNPVGLHYYANALDYKITPLGELEKQPEELRVYIPIFKRTFYIAFLVTLLTLLLGYPLAYYLTKQSDSKANFLLIFVLLPFWTSLLVRTTSWIVILQSNGVINKTLQALNITDAPLDIIYNQFSTVLAMTHILLPFMVLPLYSVMKGIDASFVKASQSLGANAFWSFLKIYFPLSLPGLNAGALLVFILAVGYYITPALIGGVDGQLISNLIAYHMRTTNNWELAAALASVLLASVTLMYWVYDRYAGVSNLKL